MPTANSLVHSGMSAMGDILNPSVTTASLPALAKGPTATVTTPETTGGGGTAPIPGNSPLGAVAAAVAAANPASASNTGTTSTSDTPNSSGTDTGTTPDELLDALATAALQTGGGSGADDTIALPVDPSGTDDSGSVASVPGSSGGGGHTVLILAILGGVGIGLWYVYKHKGTIAKLEKDV